MEKIQDQIDLSISLFIENKFSSPFEVRPSKRGKKNSKNFSNKNKPRNLVSKNLISKRDFEEFWIGRFAIKNSNHHPIKLLRSSSFYFPDPVILSLRTFLARLSPPPR